MFTIVTRCQIRIKFLLSGIKALAVSIVLRKRPDVFLMSGRGFFTLVRRKNQHI